MSGVTSSPAPSAGSTDGDHFAATWKRFQSELSPHTPVLVLNGEGSIEYLTPAARRLLGYRADAAIEPCFFSHIHSRNLYQIMRDVADMVCYGKAQASWLLRLRTARGQWGWFRARASNRLLEGEGEGTITVTLRDAHEH